MTLCLLNLALLVISTSVPEIGVPSYFFAVYADPNLPGHASIEGGRFGNRNMPGSMKPDDIVLLYCTASYTGYAKTAPGFGVVTTVDHTRRNFTYHYEPFLRPVPFAGIRSAMTEADLVRVANIRRDFLFPISPESFYAVSAQAILDGPLKLL